MANPRQEPVNTVAESNSARRAARRFVDALAVRLVELDRLATTAQRFEQFDAESYAEFRRLFGFLGTKWPTSGGPQSTRTTTG